MGEMCALDFDPGTRGGLLRRTSLTRLVLLAAGVVALTMVAFHVVPGRRSRPDAPTPPAAPPPRPVPGSLPALSPVDEAVLAEVRDHEPIRERPFYMLLQWAARQQDAPREAAPRVEAEDLIAHPDVFRGRVVRVRGTFVREYTVAYPENLSGLRRARTGEIGSPGQTLVTYVLPGEHASGCRLGDDVTVTGRFLQIRRFTSGGDGRVRSAPLIVAISLDRHGGRAGLFRTWLVGGIGVAAAVVAGVVLVTLARQGRQGRRRAAQAARARRSSE